MDNDRDLEEIRRRKLEEMQASGGAQSQSQEADRQKQEAERAMRLQILRQILDPVARAGKVKKINTGEKIELEKGDEISLSKYFSVLIREK